MIFVQNLTEYNTAHNRRISMLGISDDISSKKNKNKRKRRNVTFNDEECIINPEDVDPNVGRFRNLIQTTIIPTKRSRTNDANFMNYPTTSGASTSAGLYISLNCSVYLSSHCECDETRIILVYIEISKSFNGCFHLYADVSKHLPATSYAPNLYQDLPPIGDRRSDDSSSHYHSGFDLFSAKLGLLLPDPAPDPGLQLSDIAPEIDVQPSKLIHIRFYRKQKIYSAREVTENFFWCTFR